MTTPVNPPVTPERIMQFAWGYVPPLVLETAIRLRIFDLLDSGPKTIPEMRKETGASERGLTAVMNALVGMNFLAKDKQESFSLTPESSAFLVSTKPGYQGSLWLDPATGTVLRITLEADAKGGAPFQRASILVEYGPVQIGDSRFICPVRSVALYEATAPPQANLSDAAAEWLNVILFTGYHRFGSTVKILTDKPAPN